MNGAPRPPDEPVIDRYDAALFDLDGVVYLGHAAVPGAAEGLSALRRRGTTVGFVTNNAARPPQAVADHLVELGVEAAAADVVTSPQAAARLVAERFGPSAKVLVVGGEGIWAALAEEGLEGVRSADDGPVAVVQGWAPDLTWQQLIEATVAIQHGAHWVATNTDSTRPTDRGIVPGNGAAVDAVRVAVSVDPEVAGKPFRPLIDTTLARLGCHRPIFVGDRIDTDIAGAGVVGIDSLFVLTGAHGPVELLAAGPGERPTHLGRDLAALLAPERPLRRETDRVHCRKTSAVVVGTEIRLESDPTDDEGYLDALWALANLAWDRADDSQPLDPSPALAALQGSAPTTG